jgi:hypothetical protein
MDTEGKRELWSFGLQLEELEGIVEDLEGEKRCPQGLSRFAPSSVPSNTGLPIPHENPKIYKTLYGLEARSEDHG